MSRPHAGARDTGGRERRAALDEAEIAGAREVELTAVLTALGGARDRYDRHKWRLEGHILNVHGQRFYDFREEHGGGGAISLVMHLRGVAFAEAVRYLTGRPFPLAERAAERAAPASREPFVPPPAELEHWAAVRTYLTAERALPERLVDALHAHGLVYADSHRNAVFLRRDLEGQATGAALRGTAPGSHFKGLAPGTARAAGHFYYHSGLDDAGVAPRLALVESAIDALSLHALRAEAGERGRVLLLSTDGAGGLPHAQVERALAGGWTVQAGFDRDAAGEGLWRRLQEAYPGAGAQLERLLPSHGKDWNDSLRQATQERESAGGDEAPSR